MHGGQRAPTSQNDITGGRSHRAELHRLRVQQLRGEAGAVVQQHDAVAELIDHIKIRSAVIVGVEPREGLEILRGCWSTVLDPMCYSEDDPRNSRVVIDACKPFKRRDTFPLMVRNSKELDQRILAKFKDVLPKR